MSMRSSDRLHMLKKDYSFLPPPLFLLPCFIQCNDRSSTYLCFPNFFYSDVFTLLVFTNVLLVKSDFIFVDLTLTVHLCLIFSNHLKFILIWIFLFKLLRWVLVTIIHWFTLNSYLIFVVFITVLLSMIPDLIHPFTIMDPQA